MGQIGTGLLRGPPDRDGDAETERSMKRFEIKVSGWVQGVFFRHTARSHAEKLGLTGWVRNETDGSVTIAAEGEEQALKQFLDWCRRGPPLARVDEINVEWKDATGEFKRFEIQ